MKTRYWLILALTIVGSRARAQIPIPPAVGPAKVVETGPHYRVWQRVTSDGLGHFLTNSFTELATGLNYFNPDSHQWEESQPRFEVLKSGYAVSRKTQHQLIVYGNLNTQVAVDVQTPDNKRLQSHVLGLAYFDPVSGKNVLIAEVKDCIGELAAPNQIIFPDAFTDFRADYRLTLTRDGLEADVILREQPPAPESFGLPPETTQLQILTEFMNPPTPTEVTAAVPPSTNGVPESFAVGPNLTDQRLSIGVMAFERGRAFDLGDAGTGPAGAADEEGPVGQSWEKMQGPNGELRDFLIESVNYFSIYPQLQQLPQPIIKQASNQKAKTRRVAMNTKERQLPAAPSARKEKKSFKVAQAKSSEPGFVVDYVLLSSTSNQIFQSDSTYYVSGTATLSGVTILEGGTVIKYTNNAEVRISGVLSCQAAPYRLAILTSKDDDTVGE